MADEKTAVNVTQTQDLSTPNSVSAATTETISSERPSEKTLLQSEVNRIVGSAKQEAYEKGKREAASEYQKTLNFSSHPQVSAQAPTQEMSEDKIRSLIEQEASKRAQMEMANRIATEFTQKLSAAKDKYPDFESAVSKLNLPSIPQIVSWANSVDNTADVMYDIAKNPVKYSNLMVLAHVNPALAQEELNRLSQSIKQNEEAKNQLSPAAPLSQVKPSTTGTDNGSMGIRDYKKMPWARG